MTIRVSTVFTKLPYNSNHPNLTTIYFASFGIKMNAPKIDFIYIPKHAKSIIVRLGWVE